MLKTNGIDVIELVGQLVLLESFYTKSLIFTESNYVTVTHDGGEDILHMMLPLIVGEAISTGIISVEIPTEGGDSFTTVVSMERLIELRKALAEEDGLIDMEKLDTGALVFTSPEMTVRIPESRIAIPQMLLDTLASLRAQEQHPFPIKEVDAVMTALSKELTNNIINFNLKGVYIEKDTAVATTGFKIARLNKGSGIDYPMYLPTYVDKVIKRLPKERLTFSTGKVSATHSPHIYIKGAGVELVFQEWNSKDIYPIEQIKELYAQDVKHVDAEAFIKATVKANKFKGTLYYDFPNGTVEDKEKTITVNMDKQDIQPIFLNMTVLPKTTSLKKVTKVGVSDAGMVYLQAGDIDYFIAKATEY